MKFRYFLALLLCLLVPLLANVSAINDGDATIDDEDIPDPPFIAFAKVGNVGALENLLKSTKTEGERSAMLNTLDKKDRSALVWSLRRHKPDVARFLLKEKIDVMHKDCQNHTSLWWAIHRHEWDIAISLIEEGVEVNSDHTNPYLYTASMYGRHSGLIEKLIHAGADLDAKNVRGLTALDIARSNRRFEVVELLEKAMLERPLALHLAARHGYESLAQRILEKGKVDFTEKDENGQTALEVSMKVGSHNISKAIKEKIAEMKELTNKKEL